MCPRELSRDACASGLLAQASRRATEDLADWYPVIRRLSAAWLSFGEIMHVAGIGVAVISEYFHGEDRETVLDALSCGRSTVANCITEPEARSDVGALTTAAQEVPGGFELTGVKIWAGLAPISDYLLVYARTAPNALGGITCFLVDRSADGVRIQEPYEKNGARSLPAAEVRLEQVFVSRDRVVGRLHRAAVLLHSHLARGRIGIAACATGLTDRVLDECVPFAQEREQFGVPIIEHQLVKGQISEIYLRAMANGEILGGVVGRLSNGESPSVRTSAAVKLLCTRNAVEASGIAAALVSASGQELFSVAARLQRDALLLQTIEGTPNVLADSIAKGL